MEIIKDKIEITELREMAKKIFDNLVKAVVDVENGFMAVDAPLHSDEMEFLIDSENSKPENLWGINIYPEKQGEEFIEFDSMINLKPGFGNRTRDVENEEIRKRILEIVNKLIKK
jgi:hypothetical protein